MRSREIALVVVFSLLLGSLFVTAGAAQSGYEIELTETEQVSLIEAPDSVSISGTIARATPGADLTVDVSGPAEDEYTVYLRDGDANIVDWFALDVQGSDTVSLSTDGSSYTPGTYAATAEANEIETAAPVVITGYDIDTTAPDEATEENAFDVSADLTPHDGDVPIDSVTLVAWDGEDAEQIEMSENGTNTYDTSISDLSPGDYQLQVIVYGEDEISDEVIEQLEDRTDNEIGDRRQNEIIALGDRQTVTVTESEDGTTAPGGGGGGGGTVPAGPTTPTPDGSGDNITDDSQPVSNVSADVVDTMPDQAGTTVAFETVGVESITFSAADANGTVDIEDYGATAPPTAPGLDDRPVLLGVDIGVPTAMTTQSATIRLTLNESRFTDAAVSPENASVLRLVNGSYEPLETTVSEDNGTVSVEAETPGFSTFVVSSASGDGGESTPTPGSGSSDDTTPTDGPSDGSTDTPNDSVIEPSDGTPGTESDPTPEDPTPTVESQPGFGLIHSLVALFAALIVTVRYRSRNS
jgi:PGF-pre-PGF domain-containing protein